SAYHDKVATRAKEDLEAATSAFTEASSALSIPLSLQERLIFGFYAAADDKSDTDDNAYVTKRARILGAAYEDAYTGLREKANLLARKMEIHLDWASNPARDPAAQRAPAADPISMSMLG